MNRRLLAALSFLAVSCSSIAVNDDYDRAVDFPALKTWSWRPAPAQQAGAPDPVVSLLTARIRSALEHELIAKGYAKAETGGDFQVSFHTAVERRIESDPNTASGYGWRQGHVSAWPGPEIYTYEEGTLIVDFIDPRSNNMIWRGTATGVVDRQSSAEEREQRVQEAVHKLLALYPPKAVRYRWRRATTLVPHARVRARARRVPVLLFHPGPIRFRSASGRPDAARAVAGGGAAVAGTGRCA